MNRLAPSLQYAVTISELHIEVRKFLLPPALATVQYTP